MSHGCLSESIGRVATLEGADDAAVAPRFRARDDRPRQRVEIVELEGEAAEWVARERVESGRDQDQLWNEAFGGGVDPALERLHIIGGRQTGRLRDVPDAAMRAAVVGRAGARIPGPLVH